MTRFSDGEPLIGGIEGSEAQRERRWFYTHFRQAGGKAGAAYGVGLTSDNRWGLECILPDGTRRRIGAWEAWDDALRVQDFCVQRDIATKLAMIEFYEMANYEPLARLITDGLAFGQLPRRRLRVTIELDLEMRGTDEEIKAAVLFHARTGSGIKGARVLEFVGPPLEPRQ